GSSMTTVSRRFPHARIIAVEMLRGPDHIAMRMFTAPTVRRQGRVCNASRTTRSTEDDGQPPGGAVAGELFATAPSTGQRDGVFERKSLTKPFSVRISTWPAARLAPYTSTEPTGAS